MKDFRGLLKRVIVFVLCGALLSNGPLVPQVHAAEEQEESADCKAEQGGEDNPSTDNEECSVDETSEVAVEESVIVEAASEGEAVEETTEEATEETTEETVEETVDGVATDDAAADDLATDDTAKSEDVAEDITSEDKVNDDVNIDELPEEVLDEDLLDEEPIEEEVVIPTSMKVDISIMAKGNEHVHYNANSIEAEDDVNIILKGELASSEYVDRDSVCIKVQVDSVINTYECKYDNGSFVFDTSDIDAYIAKRIVIRGVEAKNINGEDIEVLLEGYVSDKVLYVEYAADSFNRLMGPYYVNHDVTYKDLEPYKFIATRYSRITLRDDSIDNNENVEIFQVVPGQDGFSITTAQNTVSKYSLSLNYYMYFNRNQWCNEVSFVVDKVDPVVEIKYYDSQDNEITDFSKIYNEDITVRATVDEDYIDDFTLYMLGQDQEVALRSTDTENCLEYVISEEGEFSFRAVCYDKATNSAEAESRVIRIDKTVPVVSMSFDGATAKNDIFYNQARTATITIDEKNLNENSCRLLVDAKYGSTVQLTDWTHSGSTHTCKVVFASDDEYSGSIYCVDEAGNKSNEIKIDRFIVDTTAPDVNIYFNKYDSVNDGYYNSARTAYIEVTERYFDKNQVDIDNEGTHGLSASSWDEEANSKYVTSIECTKDGEYRFYVTAQDMAGNVSSKAYSGQFTIDTVAPTIEIIGVSDRSANAGAVVPQIRYTDDNIYGGKSVVSVSGYKNGVVAASSSVLDAGTMSTTFDVFARQKASDDVYTVVAHAEDKAGNVSEMTYMFSVNRFGSTFGLSPETTAMVDQYYINGEQDIVLMETNVDNLSQQSLYITKDGQMIELSEGEGYQAQREGTDETWKSYTYRIGHENFATDGKYEVVLYTQDRAGNRADNNSQGMNVEFVVDKTAPSIVVSGLESDTRYEVDEVNVNIDVKDNTLVNNAQIIVNGKVVRTISGGANDGLTSLTLTKADHAYDVVIKAEDAAGNVTEKRYSRIYVGEAAVNGEATDTVTIADDGVPLSGTIDAAASDVSSVVTESDYNIGSKLSGNMDVNQTNKFNNIFMVAIGIIAAALAGAVALIMVRRKNK